MPNACAKTVQNWCVSTGKKCVRLSTLTIKHTYRTMPTWVQSTFIPQLSHGITTWFSTAKYANLPPLNSQLYPLSTAPTIITTKEIY